MEQVSDVIPCSHQHTQITRKHQQSHRLRLLGSGVTQAIRAPLAHSSCRLRTHQQRDRDSEKPHKWWSCYHLQGVQNPRVTALGSTLLHSPSVRTAGLGTHYDVHMTRRKGRVESLALRNLNFSINLSPLQLVSDLGSTSTIHAAIAAACNQEPLQAHKAPKVPAGQASFSSLCCNLRAICRRKLWSAGSRVQTAFQYCLLSTTDRVWGYGKD